MNALDNLFEKWSKTQRCGPNELKFMWDHWKPKLDENKSDREKLEQIVGDEQFPPILKQFANDTLLRRGRAMTTCQRCFMPVY